MPALSLASALGFWVVNAAVLASRLAGVAGVQAFLKNNALAVTVVASLPAACAAYSMVLRRGDVVGRDRLPGVGRGTVIIPFALSLGVVLLGSASSAFVMHSRMGSEWTAMVRLWWPRLLPVGAGFALMGSLVGNLAGSLTLEAKDLGYWTRINLALLISNSAFWLFLMWAVLDVLRRQIGALAP